MIYDADDIIIQERLFGYSPSRAKVQTARMSHDSRSIIGRSQLFVAELKKILIDLEIVFSYIIFHQVRKEEDHPFGIVSLSYLNKRKYLKKKKKVFLFVVVFVSAAG